MEAKDYALIFQGQVAEGFEMATVKERFTALMACDPATTERLFSGHRLIFKRFASEDAAREAAARLRQIGMEIEIAAVPKKEVSQAESQASGDENPPGDAESVAAPPAASPGATEMAPVEVTPQETRPASGEPNSWRERRVPFVFSGSGSEFFRIWIVNVLLTIVTFGIYSAWAKVRTLRYFYGNTSLDGSAFEYLAEPMKILKGRLIVFAFFAVFSVVTKVYSWTGILYLPLVFILTPWVVRQSLRFRYHYTVWRGVRFSFAGGLWDAAKAFIFWPMLSILIFTIPVSWHRQTHYLADNSRFGAASFENRSTTGDFFKMFFAIFGVMMLVAVIVGIFGGIFGVFFKKTAMSKNDFTVLFSVAITLFYIVIAIVSTAFYKVKMTNLRFGKTGIGPHQIAASYATRSYLALVVTNTLFVILTLGLFYPFAKVRTARYAAAHTEMIIYGDLDGFVAERQGEVSAVGSEAGDFLDIDIGF